MRRLLTLALLVTATPAFAALSPFYDSAEKIDTILNHGAVADALHQAPLRSIENTGTRADGASEWTVRTEGCDLVVYLIAILPNGPGKTTYELDLPKGCD